MNRQILFLATGCILLVLLAFSLGCTGVPSGNVTPTPTTLPSQTTPPVSPPITPPTSLPTTLPVGGISYGGFVLLLSDQPSAIGDFSELIVNLSAVRIYPAGNANITEIPLSTSVDLTQLTGNRSVEVLDITLEAGMYTRIELDVRDAEGIVNGTRISVTTPSDKLELVKEFTVIPSETTQFIFDVDVVSRGVTGEYNLLPVIAKSGPVTMPELERSCIQSGGSVTTMLCCNSVRDFPNLCLVGPCGCAPDNSHEIKVCDCGTGQCFNGTACIAR
jgi:hypothetical protein